MWRRDADGVGALYTEDGCFDMGLDRGPIHNHVFDIDGDRARGRCSFEIRAGDFVSFGFYEDEYARIDATWRFRSRKAVLLGAARSGNG